MLHIEVGSDKMLNSLSINESKINERIEYPIHNMIFTTNGKAAINLLLSNLGLKQDDEVFITSTFGAKYVSKCVTCSVFNHCQPSKVITPQTKVIYIIHEFGVPHPDTLELIKLGTERNIPVVEDCAHSSNSYFDDGSKVGSKGDFVIYSLKKILPMTIGGALRINSIKYLDASQIKELKEKSNVEVEKEFTKYIGLENEYSELRRKNFERLQSALPIKTQFMLTPQISPYVFSFEHNEPSKFVSKFNERFAQLCECVTWYGYPIVSFPTHQFMSEEEIKIIIDAITQTNLLMHQTEELSIKP